MPLCFTHGAHTGECRHCEAEIAAQLAMTERLRGIAADVENASGDVEELAMDPSRRSEAVELLGRALNELEAAAARAAP